MQVFFLHCFFCLCFWAARCNGAYVSVGTIDNRMAHQAKRSVAKRPNNMRRPNTNISPRNKKYSTARHDSSAPWDNIDRLVFNDNCVDCNGWVYDEPRSKGLVFLHMRKAGGTLFLRLLQEWFLSKNCLSKPSGATKCTIDARNGKICDQSTAFGGIHDRTYHTYKKERITIGESCKNIEFRHLEYSCLHGLSVAGIPSIVNRTKNSFSLFTILRNPIERHASQFFFVGPGEKYVTENIIKSCRRSNSSACRGQSVKTKKCATCTKAATEEAIAHLAKDERIWLNWMNDKAQHGFGERYMPNYYTHRLTAGATPSEHRRRDRSSALSCFSGNDDCRSDSIDVLSNVALAEYCNFKGINLDESLLLAKKIIAEQFDFLILELIAAEPEATTKVLSRVFDQAYSRLIGENKGEERKYLNRKPQPGLLRRGNNSINTATGNYYDDKMPRKVVEQLRVQNSKDIELYEYAVDLFHLRFNIKR